MRTVQDEAQGAVWLIQLVPRPTGLPLGSSCGCTSAGGSCSLLCALGCRCSALAVYLFSRAAAECPREGQEWSAISQGRVTGTTERWGQQLCPRSAPVATQADAGVCQGSRSLQSLRKEPPAQCAWRRLQAMRPLHIFPLH